MVDKQKNKKRFFVVVVACHACLLVNASLSREVRREGTGKFMKQLGQKGEQMFFRGVAAGATQRFHFGSRCATPVRTTPPSIRRPRGGDPSWGSCLC